MTVRCGVASPAAVLDSDAATEVTEGGEDALVDFVAAEQPDTTVTTTTATLRARPRLAVTTPRDVLGCVFIGPGYRPAPTTPPVAVGRRTPPAVLGTRHTEGMSAEFVANADRFSGFADLYDAHRPSPPAELGDLLKSYVNVPHPDVVDLGSGTGLSTRWAADWARSVVGVEPNADMRTQAESIGGTNMCYAHGLSHATGLPDSSADIVVAVQAMHWMEPTSTLVEVRRLLRPGGLFATVDADWPPVAGVAAAERAWATVHARIRVLEARLAVGLVGDELRAQVAPDDPALVDEDLRDTHKNRAMPGGASSWSKSEHLRNIFASGCFVHVREVVFSAPANTREPENAPDRFIALLRSQGSYHALVRRGLSDADIGTDAFEADVVEAFAQSQASGCLLRALRFGWRVRLGVLG